jgi:hypothetical protein
LFQTSICNDDNNKHSSLLLQGFEGVKKAPKAAKASKAAKAVLLVKNLKKK